MIGIAPNIGGNPYIAATGNMLHAFGNTLGNTPGGPATNLAGSILDNINAWLFIPKK